MNSLLDPPANLRAGQDAAQRARNSWARTLGAAAETLAADYLQAQGLEVRARNLRCKAGEIDLVCLDHGVLVIVEVRRRGRNDFGGAAASVTWRKQRKLIRAVQFHHARQPEWRGRLMRFDVIAIQGQPDGTHALEWIKDAFRAG